jgi:hypothetical protein
MTEKFEKVTKSFSESPAPRESGTATREQLEALLRKCALLQVRLSCGQLQLSVDQLDVALIRQKLERLLAATGSQPVSPGGKQIKTLDELLTELVGGSAKPA